MASNFGILLFTFMATEVTSFNVRVEKLSTLYLPYSYSPSETYGLGKDAAEQMVYDPPTKLLYSVGHTNIHVIDLTDVNQMRVLYNVSYENVDVTDVEICGSFLFVAMDNETDRENGFVIVYGAYNRNSSTLELIHQITVGSLPDMIHPTSDCKRLIVAIEAEPFDTPTGFVDPPGGIGIITFEDTPAGNYTVSVLDFEAFNSRYADLETQGVRFVYRGNNNTFSNDVEPEYIALNHDETKAYVCLQENNAIAVVNLQNEMIENVYGLGFKVWLNSSLDPNDKDGINLNPWPVYGMYQPDSIKVYTHKNVDYILTANEGDSKDYDEFSEETRVEDVTLSANFEPNVTERSRLSNALFRLKITNVNGKNATTDQFDQLYSYGGRGFSVWRADTMERVYDSGEDISHRTAMMKPYLFNNNAGEDDIITETMDKRSDDKGPETESLITAHFGNYTLVLIGNERPGTIAIYSIDGRLDTIQPRFETMFSDIPNVNETWNKVYNERRLSMLDPEDLSQWLMKSIVQSTGERNCWKAWIGAVVATIFVPANESPNGEPLLLVSGSYSGTITVYKLIVNDSDPDDTDPSSSTIVTSSLGLLLLCLVCCLR